MDDDAIKKTSFVTPFCKCEYLKIPFSLVPTPAYSSFTLANLDDIITFNETAGWYLTQIKIVLSRLKEAKLRMKINKYSFFKSELHYSCDILTTNGITPQSEKVKAIKELKPPTSQKGIREFLGLDGYYRKFIHRFADAARPITCLKRRDAKFEWSTNCQVGFKYLKNCLTKDPILKYPDPLKRYLLFTDA